MLRALVPIGLVCLAGGVSHGETTVTPTRVVIVGQAEAGGPWTTKPTEARLADKPRLAVVVIATERRGKRKRTVTVADEHVSPLVIGRRRVRDRHRRSWDVLADATVRWSTIEPHAWRDKEAREIHSNVSLEPDDFGKWHGYTPIRYFATAIGEFASGRRARTRAATVRSTDPEIKEQNKKHPTLRGLGTMRYPG